MESDEGLRELTRIVAEKDAQGLIVSASRAFGVAMDLWAHGSLYRPTRRDWPSVPDPKDGWMLDLALDAGAECVVTWDPHLLDAEIPFPVEVLLGVKSPLSQKAAVSYLPSRPLFTESPREGF